MPEKLLVSCDAGFLPARLTWNARLGVYELATAAGEDLGHYGPGTVCANLAAYRWSAATW